MKPQDFQKAHSAEFRAFLATPMGQAMLNTLSETIPVYEFAKEPHLFAKEPHLFAENRGARRGYENCMRNLIGLSTFTPVKKEAEMNYGVSNQPTKEP